MGSEEKPDATARHTVPRVLTIAGSDCSGGAGIQADLKTFAALGCYGTSVITAVTVQNTRGVRSVHPLEPAAVGEQLDAVLEDVGADCIKIGMLGNLASAQVVVEKIKKYQSIPVVIDPVLRATSGMSLAGNGVVELYRCDLFPRAQLITPNLPEASLFLGWAVQNRAQMAAACHGLGKLTGGAVLLKGGHLPGEEMVDLFFDRQTDELRELCARRIATRNTHGTGCTLAAAVASGLARGEAMALAVQQAKEFITESLQAGANWNIGAGHGPLHHFHRWWPS